MGERVALLSTQAYAEYDVAAATTVIKLPAALDDQPFPAEPLGCAMNIFQRCQIQTGQTVAIVGIGFLGALLTQLATHAGARVSALARRPFALEIARQSGAAETIPLDDHWRVIEQVKELTGSTGCECVSEATGHQWPLDLAAELTRERARPLGQAAYRRVLAEHTYTHRAAQVEAVLEAARPVSLGAAR